MNTPTTINIEKYAHALNNLVGMDIGYLGDSDENVNAIVEVIRAAKALENRVKELEAEKDALIKNYAQCMKDYAREIFDEIDNNFIIMSLHDKYETFPELKKKYTEVNNE